MKKLVAAGVTAAGIAGGSLAIAALAPLGLALAQDSGGTTTTTPPDGSAPKRSGVLGDALKSLVEDGTITQEQADKITARVGEKAQAFRESHPGRGFKLPVGESLEKIAGILGISVDDLKAQLKEGKTLGEIAVDKKDALITELTNAANARIDEAVANGKITAERAADLKTKTAERIKDMVENGPRFGRPGGFGFRGPR